MTARPLLVIVLTCSVVAVLSADYRDSFRRGIQAQRRERWAEVAAAMREARAEQPADTGERINISGMDFVPYVPSYYLGVALYNLKDCVGALAAWQALDARGGMQRVTSNERGTVAKYRKDCETRVAVAVPPVKPPPPPPPEKIEKPAGPDPAVIAGAAQNASAAIGRAQDGERAVAQLSSDTLLNRVWRSEAALGASEQRARDTLARAQNELEAGKRESSVRRLEEATTLANTATREYAGVRQAAENRRSQLVAEAAEAKAAVAAPPPPPPPAVPPKTDAPVNKPQSFTPPPALAVAARLFFSARYAEAAASLGGQRYPEGPAAGHAALLRAASNYSLYLVGGEQEEKLIESARQAVREARRVAPSLQPDPRAFSPRFVEFYQRTR